MIFRSAVLVIIIIIIIIIIFKVHSLNFIWLTILEVSFGNNNNNNYLQSALFKSYRTENVCCHNSTWRRQCTLFCLFVCFISVLLKLKCPYVLETRALTPTSTPPPIPSIFTALIINSGKKISSTIFPSTTYWMTLLLVRKWPFSVSSLPQQCHLASSGCEHGSGGTMGGHAPTEDNNQIENCIWWVKQVLPAKSECWNDGDQITTPPPPHPKW